MRGKSKNMIGILCMSVGTALILSIILPSWLWSALIALLLIGSGVFLFLY